jgi:hypothetical protein
MPAVTLVRLPYEQPHCPRTLTHILRPLALMTPPNAQPIQTPKTPSREFKRHSHALYKTSPPSFQVALTPHVHDDLTFLPP